MTNLFNNLSVNDLSILARSVPHQAIMLSGCRTRAVVSGNAAPIAASLLPNRLSLSVSCLVRCDVVREWLASE